MRYEPLDPPQALDPSQLAMLLPAAVAMQACITLLIDHSHGQCLIHEMLRPNQLSLVLKTSRLPISIGPASDPGESVTSVLPQALDSSQLAMLLLAAVDMHACMHAPLYTHNHMYLQKLASNCFVCCGGKCLVCASLCPSGGQTPNQPVCLEEMLSDLI